jgi:acyl carrier protein
MTIAGSVQDRLVGTVSGVLGVPADSVTGDTSPETAPSWDSLNHLNLVVALETEFAVSFTPEQVFELRSVDSIANILRAHGVNV